MTTKTVRSPLPLVIALAIGAWLIGPNTLGSLAIFVGILLFLVVAHELGHFTVAKLAKVKVLEFGVGIPPRAWAFTRGDTEYSVNWLPIGGFVRMVGEEDPTDPQSLAGRRPLTRLAVFAAGPGVNAVLPIFLLAIALMIPRDIAITDVTVLSVVEGSPAAAAGVHAGDVIREVDGRDVDNSSVLRAGIQLRLGADTEWVVEREGRLIELTIPEVRVDPPEGQGATGISLVDARVTVTSVETGSAAAGAGLLPGDLFLRVGARQIFGASNPEAAAAAALAESPSEPVAIDVRRAGRIQELSLDPALGGLTGFKVDVRPDVSRSDSLFEAIPGAFGQTWDILVTFRNEISRWISGTGAVQLSGPVGIARITGDIADAGLSPLVTWAALLSINLAIVNILPLPALDGGRITFVLLELIRGGRRVAADTERKVHLIGFALLMAAIVLVSANDIQRLIQGEGPFG